MQTINSNPGRLDVLVSVHLSTASDSAHHMEISKINNMTFSNFSYCNLPASADGKLHDRIVCSHRLHDVHMIASCSMCPVNGDLVVPHTLAAPIPRNATELYAVRDAWMAAHATLKRAQVVALEAGRMTSARHPSSAKQTTHVDGVQFVTIPSELARTEFSLFVRYWMCAFEIVRPYVIRKYKLAHEQQASVKSSALTKYVQFLSAFSDDFKTRNELFKTAALTLPMWCFQHNRPGHMFPLAGHSGYDIRCYVCPVDIVRIVPNTSRTVDDKEFMDAAGPNARPKAYRDPLPLLHVPMDVAADDSGDDCKESSNAHVPA